MHSHEATRSLRVIHESPRGAFPVLAHGEWASAFPWLIQGITTSGSLDLGLFSDGSPEELVRENWRTLAGALGVAGFVHAPQPHGSVVRVWPPGGSASGGSASGGESGQGQGDGLRGAGRSPEVLHLVAPCDGHATRSPGEVLAVTVADCVPVYLVDPAKRAVAMVHAGWRGAAAGILEAALDTLESRFGTEAEDTHLHLGPAICGDCYEVGPEVHEALEQAVPPGAEPIDLRAILGRRGVERGVRVDRVTVSGHCTLCGHAGFFSHRGGDPQRQIGFLGIRS